MTTAEFVAAFATLVLTGACLAYMVERIRGMAIQRRIYEALEQILQMNGMDPNNEKGLRIQVKERSDDEE